MVRVRFTPEGFELDLPAGERLLDVLDEQGLVLANIACRGATCGTCRVHVQQGGAQLLPAGSDERRTLAALACGPDERLACQVVGRGDGEVELRWTRG